MPQRLAEKICPVGDLGEQLCGFPILYWAFWWKRYHYFARFFLFFLKIPADRVQIVIKFFCIFLSMFTNFFDDWIIHHFYAPQ